MTVDELRREAKQLSKDEFAGRYPHLFFIFYDDGFDLSAVHFETEMARSKPSMKSTGNLRVLPMLKAETNPYSDRISIGRARNCDIVLRHSSVSKLHAHVRRGDDGVHLIYDAESHNGTSVGSKRVTAAEPQPLRSGDLVTFGAVTVRCVDAAELHVVLTRLMAVTRD